MISAIHLAICFPLCFQVGAKRKSQSRSPCLALAGDHGAAASAISTSLDPFCTDCRAPLLQGNKSCIRGYCQACFLENVAQNEARLAHRPAECMVCACAITVDNKSPTPNSCFSCWQKQEERFAAVSEERTDLPPLPPPMSPPDSPPPLSVTQCSECMVRLTPENQSSLQAFCVRCFDENVAANHDLDLKKKQENLRVKPASLSWCTWFQKVACTVGIDFDGITLPGRQALEKWKAMSEDDRRAWKLQYREWSGEPQTPEPKQKQKTKSPVSTDKGEPPAKRLPDMIGPQPRYESRVPTLQAFHKRWAWLKQKMGSEATSSFSSSTRRSSMSYTWTCWLC